MQHLFFLYFGKFKYCFKSFLKLKTQPTLSGSPPASENHLPELASWFNLVSLPHGESLSTAGSSTILGASKDNTFFFFPMGGKLLPPPPLLPLLLPRSCGDVLLISGISSCPPMPSAVNVWSEPATIIHFTLNLLASD